MIQNDAKFDEFHVDSMSALLKVLGHPERVQLLVLLRQGELSIGELVEILGISQPRVTQHVQSLEDVGVVERKKEGSWVFVRLRSNPLRNVQLTTLLIDFLANDDPKIIEVKKALTKIRSKQEKDFERFFAKVAIEGGPLCDEYLPQREIEHLLLQHVGNGPFSLMADLGTGTGQFLKVLSPRVRKAIGFDNNVQMLKVARHNLAGDQFSHIEVQKGDLFDVPLKNSEADLVSFHQVLHYLDNPQLALTEASRLLVSSGKLVIVDFLHHDREDFREKFAHRRLGFSSQDIELWMNDLDLSLMFFHRFSTNEVTPDVGMWIGKKE